MIKLRTTLFAGSPYLFSFSYLNKNPSEFRLCFIFSMTLLEYQKLFQFNCRFDVDFPQNIPIYNIRLSLQFYFYSHSASIWKCSWLWINVTANNWNDMQYTRLTLLAILVYLSSNAGNSDWLFSWFRCQKHESEMLRMLIRIRLKFILVQSFVSRPPIKAFWIRNQNIKSLI